jgi:hypothetical protein
MLRTAADRQSRERAWFLSPAIATAVFFALKLFLGGEDRVVTDAVAGAAAQGPVTAPVKVRVVAELQRADDARRLTRAVPPTEADLLRLLEQDGSVVFLSDEVEVVATPEREFSFGEVEVITSEGFRKARWAGPTP